MIIDLVTDATEEPVTLTEFKNHLRINSASFATAVTEEQSIKPDNHSTAASYTLAGSAISVLGKRTLVMLNAGTFSGSGTVDVKIQEAASASASYADWAGSAFTQVTTANDEAIQEIEYVGTKSYIKAVATVATEKSDFSVTMVTETPDTTEDAHITNLIKAARRHCEKLSNKAYVTQTWDAYFDEFPSTPFTIPLPPVQTVSSIIYTDSDLNSTTVSATSYVVDKKSFPARVNLAYNKTWPTPTLTTMNAIRLRYINGYGSAGVVPMEDKQAIMMLAAHLFENREQTTDVLLREVPMGIHALLGIDKVVVFP